MQDAFAYCADLVRTADRDRFLATLFAPAQRRDGLYSLYAFDIEIARVPEVAHEPLAGEIRLQWWSEALRGERAGEVAANPVAASLMSTVQRYALAIEPLQTLVEAHRTDLYGEPPATILDLESYSTRTSSALISHAVRIIDDGANADDVALPAGIALAIAHLLNAFPWHAARRRLLVPADILARHGVIAEDVFAGKTSTGLNRAVVELAQIAGNHLAAAGRLMPAKSPAIMPALLPLAVARLQLDRMDRLDYDAFAPPAISRWRRQWAIWRAARNPRRIAG